MKLILSQPELHRALTTCSKALSTSTVIPILETFLFDIDGNKLTITACDLHFSISTAINIESDMKLKTCLPGNDLKEYIGKCDAGPLTFEFETHKHDGKPDTHSVKISGSDYNCTLPCENGEDYPKMMSHDKDVQSFTFAAEDWNEAMFKVLFACSNDDLSPSMTGVNIATQAENVTFTTTNRHILATYTYALKNITASLIVPARQLKQIQALAPVGDIAITISKSAIGLDFGSVSVMTRLIDERFPDYKPFISVDLPIRFSADRLKLISAIKRILPMGDNVTKTVKLLVSADELLLIAENIDYAKSANEVMGIGDVVGSGGDSVSDTGNGGYNDGSIIKIGFNGANLLSALNSLASESVYFFMSMPNRAAIIREDDSVSAENLVLIMPYQIGENAG